MDTEPVRPCIAEACFRCGKCGRESALPQDPVSAVLIEPGGCLGRGSCGASSRQMKARLVEGKSRSVDRLVFNLVWKRSRLPVVLLGPAVERAVPNYTPVRVKGSPHIDVSAAIHRVKRRRSPVVGFRLVGERISRDLRFLDPETDRGQQIQRLLSETMTNTLNDGSG